MTQRDRTLIAVVVAVLVAAAAWFLVLAPQRKQAAQLSGDVATQRQALAQAQQDVAAGLAAKRTYDHDYTTVARLGAAVPEDDNVPSLLLQVQHAAGVSGIDFREMKVGGGSGAAAPPPPVTPGAPATQATTATLPPGAAVGSAGFPTMPFSFTFTGDFFRLSDFVGRLEDFLVVRNRSMLVSGRFMTIDGIALAAGPHGFPQIQANVSATAYLLPPDQGLTNGATAAAPAAATGAAPSAGASGSSAPTGPMGVATVTPVVR
ncbi:MAG: type II secretion system protein M [Actinobacteria bacterium]|nr:type II secretion system protein M [Actinomycetota bacterium]